MKTLPIMVLVMSSCAHVPTTRERLGLVRESIGLADEAFTTWFTSKQASVKTADEYQRLMDAQLAWETLLHATVDAERFAEITVDRNQGIPTDVWVRLVQIKDFLLKNGIDLPKGFYTGGD